MAVKPKTKQRESKEDKLAALRDKLANTNYKGKDNNFWSPREGTYTLRILPPVGEMDYFYQAVGRHFFPNNKYVMCRKFTSEGELDDCPVCEIVNQLYKGDKASRALAKELNRQKSFWMNVIIRGKQTRNGREPDEGPFVWTPGITVFDQIMNAVLDPEYGAIYDVDSGFDFTLKREGTTMVDTRYQIQMKRNESPLSDDPDQIEDWLAAAKDVSFVELSEDPEEDKELTGEHIVWVLPWNRIINEFDLDKVNDMDADDYNNPANDDEEEEKPKRKPVSSSSKGSVNTRRARQEEPEDEEPEDEDDEDDEEAVRQEINRRRTARKSNRR